MILIPSLCLAGAILLAIYTRRVTVTPLPPIEVIEPEREPLVIPYKPKRGPGGKFTR